MEALLQDLRYATRTLRRSPGFTLISVLTLALGIGATTAIFSVVNGVLLQPLPYPDSDRVMQVWHVGEEGGQGNLSHPNFADLREQNRSFEALAEYQSGVVTVTGGGDATRVPVGLVSGDFFSVLDVRPAMGRAFLREEQRESAPVVVVSHGYWQRSLGGDPDPIGRTVVLDDLRHTIIGVMPPNLDFPAGTELWMPQKLRADPSRTAHNFKVIGRLADGVSLEQARQNLSTIARRLKERYGDDTWMADAAVIPLHEQIVGHVRPALLILLGAAGLLLVIACTNVVNLLLARAASRRQELAVRLALGAGRQRLIQQFLTESLVLSLAGGALGVLLAVWGVDALLALEPGDVPRLHAIRVDWAVLGFTLGVAVVAAVAMGLAAALRATGEDVREVLAPSQRTQAGGAASHRLRGGLAAAQIALTLVLLVGAGLLARSFFGLLAIDPGYRTGGAVVMDLPLPEAEGQPDDPLLMAPRNERAAFLLRDLLARLDAIPGVTGVGGVSVFPLSSGGGNGMFLILNQPNEVASFEDWKQIAEEPSRTGFADFRIATEGYFRAMDIPLLRGRLFEERDGPRAPHTAVVSESLAEAQWPGEDPIGKLIQFGNMDGNLHSFTVVGVVGDVRDRNLEAEPVPTFYGNAKQRTTALGGSFNILMTGPGDPAAMIAAARRIMRDLNPEIPLRFRTLEEVFAVALDDRRFNLFLLGAFGATALLLAMMGIYGVVSYSVTQRTQEIGIRMALGAEQGRVLGLVLGQGMRMALLGIVIGLVGAFALTRLVASQLYGVSTTDPLTFAGVAVLLAAIALLASYLPARRATRVDPMVALRAE